MKAKPAIYGKVSDTGLITVKTSIAYANEGGILNPDRVDMRVVVWTSRPIRYQGPFGPEEERGHENTVSILGGVTDSKYEKAYRTILGSFEDFWKAHGFEPDPQWKRKLAVSMGEAMHKFMNEWKEMTKN